ncbi:hypothetical protein [Streptomyces hoynatensis]|uniref:Uncharacterized protein n=1 Tax=Streptomyces hoynatensis TaxID=1141874 RepID=A0A3A9YXM7_9ACTN|nr:hypothetical protein [Streptomyces hoynatensis]RKN40773.1 hypothetical protein D7294_16925 [Streptomyces hoynatensis]
MDTCTACHRTIPAWDRPRHVCTGCQQQTATALATLPGLWAALADRLDPGRTGSSGSRHAAPGSRPPVDLGIVDLRGEVLMVLDSWARAVSEDAGEELPERWEDPAAGPARWLRWRLDWAARSWAAADDLVREISDLHRAARAAATGERGERRVTVQCGCGGLLRVGVSTAGADCHGCGARYGHAEVLALPLAARAVAA